LADELAEIQDTSNIFALFVQSTSSNIITEGRSVSEEYTLSVAFCKMMPSDSYDAEQVESDCIAPCKSMAQNWLSWLIANYPRLRILATTANREYLRYDAILCGYSLTLNIKEYSVNYACLNNKQAPVPQYQRILNKMPQELREALLVWYCPKLQGLTNEELADNSGYYEGGLHDLSGNGYDVDIYGMSGQIGDGYVNDNGELVFDGVDDSVFTTNFYFSIASFYLNAPIERNSFRLTSAPNNITVWYLYDSLSTAEYNLRWRSNTTNNAIPQNSTSKLFNGDTLYTNNETYELNYGSVLITEVMRIQMGMINSTAYRPLSLRNFFAFSRTLTDTEIAWLQSNMINI